MSCKCLEKWIQNASLCFSTAAGCISRHQLVQFHNRMGPRAQQALSCAAWQHKCHNSSFLTVQWFIWGQQLVPVCEPKIEGELIFWERCQAAEQCTFHARLHNEENLIIQTEAALTQPWARLWTAYIKWALQSVRSHRGRYSRSVYSPVSYQKHCILNKKGPNGARQTL